MVEKHKKRWRQCERQISQILPHLHNLSVFTAQSCFIPLSWLPERGSITIKASCMMALYLHYILQQYIQTYSRYMHSFPFIRKYSVHAMLFIITQLNVSVASPVVLIHLRNLIPCIEDGLDIRTIQVEFEP